MSWPLVDLSKVCDINIGKTPARADSKYWGKGYPWLSIADMNQGKYLSETKEQITKIAVDETKIKLVPAGTVLFSFKLSIGKIGITEQPMFTNEAIAALPIIDEKKLCKEYLVYALTRMDASKTTDRAVMGATLNKKKLAELKIPLPPLPEQKRIAAILDKADAIRRKRQQAIQLADEFLRSVFLELFGDPVTNPKEWELKLLSDICKKITDGTHHSPPITSLGIPYITAKHLKSKGLEFFKDPWYISEKSHKEIYARCAPEKHDVLYIKDGATTGLAAINEYDFQFSMLSSLALLKPNREKILPEYLCMFLNHPRSKLVITANMAGAAITRLTLAKIKEIRVPLPSLSQQQKFSDTYWKVRGVLNKISTSSSLSSDSFDSLSQKAFSGEL